MKLETDRLKLRIVCKEDMELLRSWRNRYALEFFSAEHVTKEMQSKWYDGHAQDSTDMMWIISEKSTDEPCGTIALYHISLPNRTAELGRILLLDDFRGKGYMEEAIRKVIHMAFEVLNLYKVRVFAFTDNLSGLSLYEKAGFSGTKRPIVLLERTNFDFTLKKPFIMTGD